MKLSELTADIVMDYCGISNDNIGDITTADLINKVLLPAAREFIKSHTGLTAEQCDEHEEFPFACMVLVDDMYTHREYTIKSDRQLNPTVATILGMHSVNYL